MLEFIKNSNLEYLTCYKNLSNYEDLKENIIYYPSLLILLVFNIGLLLFIFKKKILTQISEIYIDRIRNINHFIPNINKNNINDILSIIEDNNEYEIDENFEKAKTTNVSHCSIYLLYLKNKIVLLKFCLKKKNFNPISFQLLLLSFYFNIYYFITIISYNEEYIYEIKSFPQEIKYILVKEWNRLLIVFILSISLYNLIYYIFFENEKAFKEANENLKNKNYTSEYYTKKIVSLKYTLKIYFMIGNVIIFILNSFILLFIILFGNIMEFNVKYMYAYLVIGIIEYLIFYLLIFAIITLIRFLSIEVNCKGLFIISNWVAEKL